MNPPNTCPILLFVPQRAIFSCQWPATQTHSPFLPLRQKAKASSKKAKCVTGPAGVSLAEPVHEMIERGAPLTRADRSGLTVVDAAAACDAELLHYMLLECSLKPTDALSYAIKHGDAPAAKVGQEGFGKGK